MPDFITDISQTCKRCSRPIPPGALACDSCQTLVNADELERLAAQARDLEARNELQQAHQVWQSILPLLPPKSKQAGWIREHLREVEAAVTNADRQRHAGQTGRWMKRLAPLSAMAALLAKGKTLLAVLFKLKFLFSFAAFIGVYWAAFGFKFGIGFAMLILLHEMGHYIEIKRRGLPAELPVFIPGLVAYVRWDAIGVSLETRAAVSLAGPLAGFLSAAACGLIGVQTGDPIWTALAYTGAWLNLLNLVPIWVLDGAGAMRALSVPEKLMVMLTAGGIAYATHEFIFWAIAGGALLNMILARYHSVQPQPAQPGVLRLDLNGRGDGQQAAAIAYSEPAEGKRRGSPLIAAYYIALLAALGAVVYLLPSVVR